MSSSRVSLRRRVTSFGALPLLGFLAPLLVLPIIARAVEADVWASLLTSQAVGSVAGLLILSGWGVYGQAIVASAETTPDQKSAIYATSLKSRVRVCCIVLPLFVVVGHVIARSTEPVTSTLMLLGAAWSGFSLAWYAVGSGRAGWIARYEIAPRLAATAASAIVIVSSGPVWSYPALVLLLTSCGLATFHKREFGRFLPRVGKGLLPHMDMRERARSMAFSAIGATYGSSPLPIASLVGIGAIGPFASADRLYRYALFTISTLGNALQEWVLGTPHERRLGHHSTAIRMHIVLGVAGGLALGLLGPLVGSLLFGSHVAPTWPVCAGYGVAFFFLSVSTPLTRNVLIASGRANVVLRSVLVSAVTGILLMSVLGVAYGGVGIAFGAAAAEAINLLMLASPALSLMGRQRRSATLRHLFGRREADQRLGGAPSSKGL